MLRRRVTVATALPGVHRRQHEVAGDRRLQRDVRRLGVAHLTEHDDVRVLPQQGAEHAAEGQADLLLDGGLIDAGQLVLDRIFDGRDVALDRMQAC